MIEVIIIVNGLGLGALTLLVLSFFISSIWEREKRATAISGIMSILFALGLLVFIHLSYGNFFNNLIGMLSLLAVLSASYILHILLLWPIGANPTALLGTKGLISSDVKPVDERDTVFSRVYMERKQNDDDGKLDASRNQHSDDARLSPNLAMAEASHTITRYLSTPETIAPKVSEHRQQINPEDASIRVKGYAKRLGASTVGITEINPAWIYSHRGKSGIRTNEWGQEVELDHKYAIVFTTEMDVDLIGASPYSPVIIETLSNYAKGAFIAAQLASFIANLGYEAKANHMSRYDALMVPLAVDAGLGELSRMGYLITKEYGPRVRLAAVTTNLPLVTDKPVDIGVVDFCKKCSKCANCCPSDSIPLEDREVVNGSLRWTIDADSCHDYWKKVGTDCGICMAVCPWSHARTFPHMLITEAVCRNSISRSLFNWMDDLFYGKKLRVKDPPDWAGFDLSDTTDQSDDLIN